MLGTELQAQRRLLVGVEEAGALVLLLAQLLDTENWVDDRQLLCRLDRVINLVMLGDAADHNTIALYPDQKACQQMASRPAQYFRGADAGNACPEWQETAGR